MKKYQNQMLTGVICNQCGREMTVEDGILKEGCFSADTVFGYFSGRDGENHKWDLCEECYNTLIQSFRIPATIQEETELL